MSTNTWILIIVGALLAGGLVLAALKGILKMILLAASIIGAIVTYYWLQKYGFSYLSFLTAEPESWMVNTLSIVGAVFVFAVFQHGLSWFGNIFSWGGGKGIGGMKGIVTTVLMCLFIVWLTGIGVSYFGSLSEIRRYKDIVKDTSARTDVSPVSQVKSYIESSGMGGILSVLDPMKDAERLKLAKIVAYMSSEENRIRLDLCQQQLSQYVPNMHRIRKLASDQGIQSLMKKNDMGTLLGDPKLTKLLSDDQIRGGLKTLDIDRLFGMKQQASSGEKKNNSSTKLH